MYLGYRGGTWGYKKPGNKKAILAETLNGGKKLKQNTRRTRNGGRH